MIEDNKDGLSHLIEKELNSNDKILKPDFSQKAGRQTAAPSDRYRWYTVSARWYALSEQALTPMARGFPLS